MKWLRKISFKLIDEYDIETADDIQEALKDLLGGTIKSMMEAEMDEHLANQKNERSDNPNYRNGTKRKTVRSNYGEFQIDVPQDRDSSFEPKVVKKRQKDISEIDQKIISMYARGMTTRQISDQIEEIYGFERSEGFISDVTDNCSGYIFGKTGRLTVSIRYFSSMRSIFLSEKTRRSKSSRLASF